MVNTYLAESWEEESERINTNDLIERREQYSDACPDGVLVVTAGVDVQADRLEALVCGHGKADELWFLDHRIFYGSPASDDLWQELADYLLSRGLFQMERISRLPRHWWTAVMKRKRYQFVKRMAPHRINASKGIGGTGRPICGRPSKSNSAKVPVFPVGTNQAKDVVLVVSRFRKLVSLLAHS